jgi:hypothetical protein
MEAKIIENPNLTTAVTRILTLEWLKPQNSYKTQVFRFKISADLLKHEFYRKFLDD